MAEEWWVAGMPIFAPHTLHQRAHSSSHGGQGDGYHSLHSSTRGFCLDHLTHAGVGLFSLLSPITSICGSSPGDRLCSFPDL